MQTPTIVPKGLFLRNPKTVRDSSYALDCRNVEKNFEGELRKRWGYDKVLDTTGIIDLWEYVGAGKFELIALKSDGIYRLEGSSFVKIPNMSGYTPTWSEKTRPVEYNKCLYWTDPTGKEYLWKYDGYRMYRAGVPAPTASTVSIIPGGAGTYYYRINYLFRDINDNYIWSDFYDVPTTSGDNPTFTFQPLSNALFEGFYNRHAEVNGPQTIHSGNLTLNVLAGHNYVAGDVVTRAGVNGYALKIDSVGATTITFTSASVGTGSYSFSSDGSINGGWYIQISRSTQPDYGYELLVPKSGATLQGENLEIKSAGFTVNVAAYPITTLLTTYFDPSQIRTLPPKMKYITLHDNRIIGGFLLENLTDLSLSTRPEDTLVWSDVVLESIGSSVENFLANNIRAVGNSEEGVITGLMGNDDNLIIHKTKQSYSINGDFTLNSLRIRSLMTSAFGSGAHYSCRKVDGGHIYLTNKGVYLSLGGARPQELSDIINPFFSKFEFLTEQAVAIDDFLREKIYIYMPHTGGSIVLVYDYYFKEWYVHDNIPGSNGFVQVNNDIYFSNGTSLFKRNLSSKKDNTAAIKAYYLSNFHHLGIPSLTKKFVYVNIHSIDSTEWTCNLKSYLSYSLSKLDTDVEFPVGGDNPFADQELNIGDSFAVAIELRNEKVEDIIISGYELVVEGNQTLPKGKE